MTDNEIIKALEEAELFLRNRTMDGMSLKLNEYDIGILRDISQVCAKAYDEINRLQAENEELDTCKGILISDKFELLQQIKEQDAEIERLEKLSKHHQTLITMLNEGIAEARKEFAERIKDLMQYKAVIYDCDIDNLLIEMESENNVD